MPQPAPTSTVPTKAWLVDLDGTLYRPGPVKRRMAISLVLRGWSVMPTIRAFRREHEAVRRLLDRGDAGLDPFQLQLQRAADRLGLPVDRVRADIEEWMFERPARILSWFRRTSLVAEIDAFRRTGGRCAVVSDYPALRKLEGLGLSDRFEVVVASGEPGGPPRLKPDPAGYLSAAERLGVAPEDCLVIGDRADADGEAAQRAGMRFRQVGRR